MLREEAIMWPNSTQSAFNNIILCKTFKKLLCPLYRLLSIFFQFLLHCSRCQIKVAYMCKVNYVNNIRRKAISIHTAAGVRHTRPWAFAHFANPVRLHRWQGKVFIDVRTSRPAPRPYQPAVRVPVLFPRSVKLRAHDRKTVSNCIPLPPAPYAMV